MKTRQELPQKLFKDYMKRFNTYSDEEIIEVFNSEVECIGWVSARASFLGALHKQFDRRNFDYSLIGDERSLSFKYHIYLKNKRILIPDIT
jgi:hypothetical protein